MKKAFFEMVSGVRTRDDRKVTELSEEDFKKFPEWWSLAGYLSEDIRDSAIGLVITLIGLLIEMGVSFTM